MICQRFRHSRNQGFKEMYHLFVFGTFGLEKTVQLFSSEMNTHALQVIVCFSVREFGKPHDCDWELWYKKYLSKKSKWWVAILQKLMKVQKQVQNNCASIMLIFTFTNVQPKN